MKRLDNGKWEFDRHDTGDLGPTVFRTFISEGLRAFLREHEDENTVAGCPGDMFDIIGVARNSIGTDFKKACKMWHKIIREMIFAFEYDEDEDNKYSNAYYRASASKTKNPVTKYRNEQKIKKYHEERRKLEARRKAGFEYFTRYFDNLWW